MGNVLAFPGKQDSEVRTVSLDEGYTRIANELIEELLTTDLAGREFKIVLCVIRRTYGFGKSVDWIALSQFVEMTGIDKCHVSSIIKGIVDRKIFLRKTLGNDQKLGINTTVSEWQKQKVRNVTKNGNKHRKKGNESNKNGNKTEVLGNHKRKEKIEKKNNKDIVSDANASQTIAAKKTSRKRYRYEQADMDFAEFMFSQISIVANDRKQPNFQAWANTIRLMREQDGRLPVHINTLFQFANRHPTNNSGFTWSTVILSPDSLRKHWGKIAAQYHQDRNNENNKSVSQRSDEDSLDWMP